MSIRLVDVRTHDSIILTVDTAPSSLKVQINTDDLEIASEII